MRVLLSEGPAVPLVRSVEGIEVRIARRPRLPRNAREGVRYFLGIPRTLLAIRRLVREVRPEMKRFHCLSMDASDGPLRRLLRPRGDRRKRGSHG